jgi:hypothetical protein
MSDHEARGTLRINVLLIGPRNYSDSGAMANSRAYHLTNQPYDATAKHTILEAGMLTQKQAAEVA